MPDQVLLTAAGVAIGFLLAYVVHLGWRLRHARSIRQDAVRRSQAATSGKAHEQLAPYLPNFAFNPRDVRFVGSPVDLVVFDGLSNGAVDRVVFVEVKTGASRLSDRERQVREAIQSGRVEWQEHRHRAGA